MAGQRWVAIVAAGALMAASLLSLYLAFAPSGLGQVFGEDEFGPISGVVLVILSLLGAAGIIQWSRLRWLGIALAVTGALFWVLFAFNTTPPGLSILLAALYVVSAACLAIRVALGFRGKG
jgi:hypothetical protein